MAESTCRNASIHVSLANNVQERQVGQKLRSFFSSAFHRPKIWKLTLDTAQMETEERADVDEFQSKEAENSKKRESVLEIRRNEDDVGAVENLEGPSSMHTRAKGSTRARERESSVITDVAIGSHLKKKNVFLIENISNRTMRLAVFLIYGVFIAMLVLELVVYLGDPDSTSQLAIRLSDAEAQDPVCLPRPSGTCVPAVPEITSEEADLLANTMLVSSGLNVTNWEGTGAKPGTPPFEAHDIKVGDFMTGNWSLDYRANPQLHESWERISSVSWFGYSSSDRSKNRITYFDLMFTKLDGDWPKDMDEYLFPFQVEGYSCVQGAGCESVGNYRKMLVDEHIFYHTTTEVNGNVYKVRVAAYAHRLGDALVEALGWRVVSFSNPAGVFSDCLAGENCIVEIVTSGEPNEPKAAKYVFLGLFVAYLSFFCWWTRTLYRKLGSPAKWATEHLWLLLYGVGYLCIVNILFVINKFSISYMDEYIFREKMWAASIMIMQIGFTINFFVLACFCDAPRRYVATKRNFYGFKVSYCLILLTAQFLTTLYRFPGASGRDEAGTESQIGDLGYVTAPENWSTHDQRVHCSALLVLLVFTFFGFAYYIWANRRSLVALRSLPYAMTRPVQLTSRFFVWATTLWLVGMFALLVIDIQNVVNQDQSFYRDRLNNISRLTVALDSMYFFDGIGSAFSRIYKFFFLTIFQCLFLPPAAGEVAETHYKSEEEAGRDGKKGHPKYLLVLERARLLLQCSSEVYLPFDTEEMEKCLPKGKNAGLSKNDERVTEDGGSFPMAELGQSEIVPKEGASIETTTRTEDKQNVSRIDQHHPNDKGEVLKTKAEALSLDGSDQHQHSLSSIDSLPTDSGRLAGDPGIEPRFLPWENTWEMGCRVVARVCEPVGANLHDTHALILRHTTSGDLIVVFRGTKTTKQVKTDLMSSRVEVDLDSFLATAPKKKISFRRQSKERTPPEVVEGMLRRGEKVKVRLTDLLHVDENGILPDFLKKQHKVVDRISGNALIHFGFWSSYSRVRKELHTRIYEELLAKPGRLLITGHSLGGAQATLCAYDMCRWVVPTVKREIVSTCGRAGADRVRVSCYTFGSPRVGNTAFRNAYNTVIPDTQRNVNDGDVITGNPPFWLGFHHVGRENIFDVCGCIRVNPSLIERNFSQSRSKASPHFCANYRDVVDKSFHPVANKEMLLDKLREAYGQSPVAGGGMAVDQKQKSILKEEEGGGDIYENELKEMPKNGGNLKDQSRDRINISVKKEESAQDEYDNEVREAPNDAVNIQEQSTIP